MADTASYEEDFVEWAIHSAELLRSGRYDELDLEHLAEEVDGLGYWFRRQAKDGIRKILKCLIRMQLQPEGRKRSSWFTTIVMQRRRVSSILEDSPSLRTNLEERLQELYSEALRHALAEARITSHRFPAECSWTLDQLIDAAHEPLDGFQKDDQQQADNQG